MEMLEQLGLACPDSLSMSNHGIGRGLVDGADQTGQGGTGQARTRERQTAEVSGEDIGCGMGGGGDARGEGKWAVSGQVMSCFLSLCFALLFPFTLVYLFLFSFYRRFW